MPGNRDEWYIDHSLKELLIQSVFNIVTTPAMTTEAPRHIPDFISGLHADSP